jgi:hypothetical protein
MSLSSCVETVTSWVWIEFNESIQELSYGAGRSASTPDFDAGPRCP